MKVTSFFNTQVIERFNNQTMKAATHAGIAYADVFQATGGRARRQQRQGEGPNTTTAAAVGSDGADGAGGAGGFFPAHDVDAGGIHLRDHGRRVALQIVLNAAMVHILHRGPNRTMDRHFASHREKDAARLAAREEAAAAKVRAAAEEKLKTAERKAAAAAARKANLGGGNKGGGKGGGKGGKGGPKGALGRG